MLCFNDPFSCIMVEATVRFVRKDKMFKADWKCVEEMSKYCWYCLYILFLNHSGFVLLMDQYGNFPAISYQFWVSLQAFFDSINILRIFYYYFISTALVYFLQVFHIIASMSSPPQLHNLCSTGDWEFLLYTQIIIQMLLVLICINFHPKLIHLTF